MSRKTDRITDELLVLAAQEGSETAFAALFERWQRRLLAHAYRRVGDADGAQDVAQEAWIGIATGLRRLDDPGRFPAWSLRIVTHKCQDWLRRRTRRQQLHDELERRSGGDLGIAANGGDELDEIRLVLRSLTQDKREALRLFYLEELSIHEIAEALDLPEGTVKSRLFHARKEFKAALERRTS